MKSYRQFLIDTEKDEKLAAAIKNEMAELFRLYPDKTDRELLTIAAKAHGYGFNVLDVMNTQIFVDVKKDKH